MIFVVLAVLAAGLVVAFMKASRSNQERQLQRRAAVLAPVKKLADEDITALGTELQDLDLDVAGHQLDAGANADYQRALDAYEAAKQASDAMTSPDQVRHVTEIVEDGRYAMACVRARVAGQPLPVRRPPCFFDPRHGLSARDVPFTPPGGQPRQVPACELDAQRVEAGAEPDSRQIMVGTQRMPYWMGGPQYQPYARGYFGSFGPLDWMFMGFMFEGLGDGLGALASGLGDLAGGVGDGLGDVFGGIGDMFDF